MSPDLFSLYSVVIMEVIEEMKEATIGGRKCKRKSEVRMIL